MDLLQLIPLPRVHKAIARHAKGRVGMLCRLHSSASSIKSENDIEMTLTLPEEMYNDIKTTKGICMGESSIANITDGRC